LRIFQKKNRENRVTEMQNFETVHIERFKRSLGMTKKERANRKKISHTPLIYKYLRKPLKNSNIFALKRFCARR